MKMRAILMGRHIRPSILKWRIRSERARNGRTYITLGPFMIEMQP